MLPVPENEMNEEAQSFLGGEIGNLSSDEILRQMTIAQYAYDLCLNEIERRGELTFRQGFPVVPYCSEHFVDTILTRRN